MASTAQEGLQRAKSIVRDYQEALGLDKGTDHDRVRRALETHYSQGMTWYGVEPFNVLTGPESVAETFWKPLLNAFGKLQRRDDIMLAGRHKDGSVWVCTMGHLVGLFDKPWLNIPPTGRLCFLRYCEFSRVNLEKGRIDEACVHVDVLGVMHQAGHFPLPPPTGVMLNPTPGPMTHDGILTQPQDEAETAKTFDLLERHIACHAESDESAARFVKAHWDPSILWYGPGGIGSTGLTLARYQRQHQLPFRQNLYDKEFVGHRARFAEGKYEAWWGWPNLTNKASGGFLGLPGDAADSEMRVVDIYRIEGDKLAENWVFIDMLHYLKLRGLDVLKRMQLLNSLGDE